ncbi:MAG: sulfide/dihydroorotate dehydrogenase-like FAD/NAD-binding protein [Eggerthellaceae bacterium]|nr:sulfide/dihydroorotate dehydrogenase-like FAD/NAD-binding protein [Eggerthellaceae bacterium]
MYPIKDVVDLNDEVVRMVVEAPAISKKVKPGQFIMLRIDEQGERIPLTVNDANPEQGTITLVFQKVGATTRQMGMMTAGQSIRDVAGPLGKPTDFSGAHHVCVIGGGLGTAIAYPQAKWLHDHHIPVDVITGFRTEDLIILADEVSQVCDTSIVMTDDGSNGHKGLVTAALQERIDAGAAYDLVVAVGPLIMMKFVAKTTAPYHIKTLVSMNPLMIDGTGMCGGCRVRVGDHYLHACIDGPDFDGHQVDFDEAMRRSTQYRSFERQAEDHRCRLLDQLETVGEGR